MSFCFFFFQAEDGIRDGHVTGVQTCALPISVNEAVQAVPLALLARDVLRRARLSRLAYNDAAHAEQVEQALAGPPPARLMKIGRASCRERGWVAGEAASVKKEST